MQVIQVLATKWPVLWSRGSIGEQPHTIRLHPGHRTLFIPHLRQKMGLPLLPIAMSMPSSSLMNVSEDIHKHLAGVFPYEGNDATFAVS